MCRSLQLIPNLTERVQSSGQLSMIKQINAYKRKANNQKVFPLFSLVVVYEIHVHTGSKLGAETDSNVYIILMGTRGDTGKRKLHRSKKNKVKFQQGQVKKKMCKAALFLIKAESLLAANRFFKKFYMHLVHKFSSIILVFSNMSFIQNYLQNYFIFSL